MPSDRPSRTNSKPPSKPPVDALVGRVIHEKYKITALVARGGMGKVYKAEQAPLGRVCAVKVLTPPQHEADDGQFHKRFFLEASIGAKLTHPNTVTIFDYGVEDGLYFIAMEYLDGRTLARVLREDGAFDEERSTHIARQICRSLREAHAMGVVHRDLKPANVYLVDHGDENDVVKVLDFGLVKSVESDGSEDLTQAGLFMGSPKYMAPEQVKGEHVDARADVYALGVILYEMVTGKVPYDKAKQLDTLLAQVNEALPPLRDKKPDLQISAALESIILRCLAKNPADRFSGMDEVLAALKGVGGGAYTATRTGAVDTLTASQSFTPQPLTSHAPMSMSGEIPAANPTSIMPPGGARSSRGKSIGVALFAVAALAVAGAYVTRMKSNPQTPGTAAAAEKPVEKASVPQPNVASNTASATQAPAAKAPEEHFVDIDSDPVGARVRDEQKSILCDKTPCKVRVEAPLTVSVEADGYGDQKVKLATGDPRHLVKLTKNVWHAAPKATSTGAATAAPTGNAFKPDPYGGPY